MTPTPFTRATEYLMNLVACNPSDRESIRVFLEAFAQHILLHTTPAAGSTIRKYQGMSIAEIAKALPDMEVEP